MKRNRFAAGLALGVVVVLGLACPVAAGEPVPFKGTIEGDVIRGQVNFPFANVLVNGMGKATHLGKSPSRKEMARKWLMTDG